MQSVVGIFATRDGLTTDSPAKGSAIAVNRARWTLSM
jgi:hypothetical protein